MITLLNMTDFHTKKRIYVNPDNISHIVSLMEGGSRLYFRDGSLKFLDVLESIEYIGDYIRRKEREQLNPILVNLSLIATELEKLERKK